MLSIMEPTIRNTPRRLRLDRERRKYGIPLKVIAAEAAKTSRGGTMGLPSVSNVLRGRYKSKNVVATVKRLIADAKAKQPAEQAPAEVSA